MDPAALAVFGLALFLNAWSPGPGIAALVARVLSDGARSVVPFLLAFWIGELLWLSAAAMGLGLLARGFGTAFLLLKWIGVAYLLWLAWGMWTRPAREPGELPRAESPWAVFAAGFALTMGNPKIMVFYLAVLPTLVPLGEVTAGMLAALCATALLAMAAADLFWTGLAARARRWLRTPRALRLANRVGAGALGGAAVAIAAR